MKVFCPFFYWIVSILLLLNYMSCLYILEINRLSVTSLTNIFSFSIGCLFLCGFLCCAKACKFDLVSFVYFWFYFYCLGSLTYKNIGLIYIRECLPILSSSFMVLCLMFKSLSHFEFIFVHGMRVCSNFIDLYAAIQLS